jgi:hypothetical protein
MRINMAVDYCWFPSWMKNPLQVLRLVFFTFRTFCKVVGKKAMLSLRYSVSKNGDSFLRDFNIISSYIMVSFFNIYANWFSCMEMRFISTGWNSTCQLLCSMGCCRTCPWYCCILNNFQPFLIVFTSAYPYLHV